MLRRASVTIYMTQDIDTLGKDSELAATLAQGNIVIAYVESTTVDELTARFRDASYRLRVARGGARSPGRWPDATA